MKGDHSPKDCRFRSMRTLVCYPDPEYRICSAALNLAFEQIAELRSNECKRCLNYD